MLTAVVELLCPGCVCSIVEIGGSFVGNHDTLVGEGEIMRYGMRE